MLRGPELEPTNPKGGRTNPAPALVLLAVAAPALALALAGCGGSSAAVAAGSGSGGPVCQHIESAWTAFEASDSASAGNYGALSSALGDALTGNKNFQLAEDDFNLSTDAANISAQGLPGPEAFLTDAQALAKDCGTTLPFPSGTALPQPKS